MPLTLIWPFLIIFFSLTLNERSVSALKGILGFMALCLALYSRIWHVIVPFAFILVAVSSYAFRQKPSLAKISICLLGIFSIVSLVVYWGGVVQPDKQQYHYMAITIWLPVLVISIVGAYLWPLILLVPIKRSTWIVTGFLSPLFIGFISEGKNVQNTTFGGLVEKSVFAVGEVLFGCQAANWIFLPLWIVGLALLIHMLMLAFKEIREREEWSESPLIILSISSLGFLSANMLTPLWAERYLAPFFICVFPFIPNLTKRWKKAIWAWIFILLIIALSHMVVQTTGYKRGKIIKYEEGVEKTLKKIDQLKTPSL